MRLPLRLLPLLVVLAGCGSSRPPAPVRVPLSSVPGCAPAVLNRSSILPGTSLSVSPLPDSRDAAPETQISFLGLPARELRGISERGAQSGLHAGALRAYSQGDGASFLPQLPFVAGERVSVSGRAAATPFRFEFLVAEPLITHQALPAPPAGGGAQVASYRSRPDLHPPRLTVDTPASAAVAPGLLFLTPFAGPGQDGPLIADDDGETVWFDPLPPGQEATDLQTASFRGQPVLTWWQGRISPLGFGAGEEVIADSSYRTLATVQAGNGYGMDLHDFTFGPRNTALFTVFESLHCDLRSVHGAADGGLTDGLFQEVDLGTGLVRREWHFLDHVPLSASEAPAVGASLSVPYDAFHINAIDLGLPGRILLSARNTWAAYEVDPSSGRVVLTIGGRDTSLAMDPGAQTAWQHDVEGRPGGLISVFDNGAMPVVHPQSRGLILRPDPATGTVALVRQYTHPQPLSAGSQGDMQALPDGHQLLGWGAQPYVTEESADGRVLFDAHLPAGGQSYRSFRFPWTGHPAQPPALARFGASAYASWNGATDVARWQLETGTDAAHLSPTGLPIPRLGFETTLPVPHGSGPRYAVIAEDARGDELGRSALIG